MSPTSILGKGQLGAAQLGQVDQVTVQPAAFEADGSCTVAFGATVATVATAQVDGSSSVSWSAESSVSAAVQIDGGSTVSWSGTVVSAGGGTVTGAFRINGAAKISWEAYKTVPPGTVIIPNHDATIWMDWSITPDQDITETILMPSGVKWHNPVDGTLELRFTVASMGVDGFAATMNVDARIVFLRFTGFLPVTYRLGYLNPTMSYADLHVIADVSAPALGDFPDLPLDAPGDTFVVQAESIVLGTEFAANRELVLAVAGIDDWETSAMYLSGRLSRNSDLRVHWLRRDPVDNYPGLSGQTRNAAMAF